MPPQTTPQSTAPQPDVQALALTKAIRQQESGGNYNQIGDNATSTGAYQYQPATWSMYAKQVLGDPNAAMTPENQNAVTYGMVKTWKDQGLGPAQIAAAWNAGEAKATDGSWANNVGTTTRGGKPLNYNTPAYVQAVVNNFRQIYPSLQTQYSAPVPQVQPSTPVTPDSALNGFQNTAANLIGGKALAQGAGFALSGAGNNAEQLAAENDKQVTSLINIAKTYPSGDPRRTKLLQEAEQQSSQLADSINQTQGLAPTNKEVIGSALQLPLTLATIGSLAPAEAAVPEAGSLAEAIGKNVTGGASKSFLDTAAGKILKNTVLGSAIGGTSSMAQGGDIASGAEGGAAAGFLGGSAGELISKLADYVPARILQSALPQLANNPEALDSALAKTKFGSVATNLEDVQSRLNSYKNQIKGFITDPEFRDWKLTADDILPKVSEAFPNSEMTNDQMLLKMKASLPNDSALITKLQNGGLNLEESNNLRELLDKKVFKANVFDQPEMRAGKDLAASFTNAIRNKVQATDPYLAKIFDQYHQELYLKGALEKVGSRGGMVNGKDLLDPIIGGEIGGKKGLSIAAAFDWLTRQPGVKISAAKLLNSGIVQGTANAAATAATKGSALGSAL